MQRWKRLSAKSLELCEEPDDQEVESFLQQPEEVAELRRRLSHISWFMAMLDESVARAANAEDGSSGHFWQERFRCQALNNEAAILACAVYIDLNRIRAMLAQTPETSRYSSVYDRIQDWTQEKSHSTEVHLEGSAPDQGQSHIHAGWLAPICLDGDGTAALPRVAKPSADRCIPLDQVPDLPPLQKPSDN